MARPLRIDAPGLLHHVIVRGNERRPIFRDDDDRTGYLVRLERYRARFQFHLLAYCLMTDHVHLAIRTGIAPLAKVMQSLLTSYTQFFNRRHDRVGHLFQGRYKAFLVEEERYFLALLRYIHVNPVSARMCARPEQHPWSSAAAFLEGRGPEWLDLDEAFRLLAHRPSEARRVYRALMNQPEEAEGYPNRAIQGDQEFIARMVRSSEISLPRELVVRDVAEAVAEAFGSSVSALRSHEHGSARLRAAVAYLSREEGEISVARTAKFLRRSESAVSRAVRDLEASLAKDVTLKRRLARVGRLIRDAAPVRVPAAVNPFRNVRLRE